jgi:hypothetical protein
MLFSVAAWLMRALEICEKPSVCSDTIAIEFTSPPNSSVTKICTCGVLGSKWP